MSSVNSFETDMRKLRRKKKTKRMIKNTIFICAVILIAAAIYITQDMWIGYLDGILEKAQAQISRNDTAIAEGNFPLDISKKTNTAVTTLNNRWALFADTEFYVYTHDGDIEYSTQVPYSNPIISSSDKRTLIYDLGGYNFTLMSSKKQVYTKKLTDQILLGAVGADGTVAIVTSTDKYPSYLTVYDRNGSEIYRWANKDLITAVSLNDLGTGCIVSTVKAYGGEFLSTVIRLDFNSTEVAYKSETVKALAFAIEYTAEGGVWLVADNALYLFDSNGAQKQYYEYDYNLAKYSVSKTECVLVFESIGANITNVTIFDHIGSAPKEVSYSEKINHIYVNDGSVYFVTDTQMTVMNCNGEKLYGCPLDKKYRSFAVLENNAFLLGYSEIERLDLAY